MFLFLLVFVFVLFWGKPLEVVIFAVVLTVLLFSVPGMAFGRFRSIQGGACHFDYSYPAL